MARLSWVASSLTDERMSVAEESGLIEQRLVRLGINALARVPETMPIMICWLGRTIRSWSESSIRRPGTYSEPLR